MNTVQNYNIFKNLMLYTFVMLMGFLVYKLQIIMILFFAAFIVASSIEPVVKYLSQKMPRKSAVILVTVFGVVSIALFLVPFLNILIAQSIAFLKNLPAYWEKLSLLTTWLERIRKMHILPDIAQLFSFASSLGQNVLSSSIDSIKNIVSAVMFTFLTAMLTLYMLMDRVYLKDKILSFFPVEKREKAVGILSIISQKVGGYVISQIIIISIICVILSLALLILKVEFSLILGFSAAVLELIPVVGPIISAVLIFLAAFAQKPVLGVVALVVYGIVQWFVDNVVRPFVFSKFLSMHPLTFIFSLFVGASFFGVAGMLLAPAFAAAICVLIDELYLKRINAAI